MVGKALEDLPEQYSVALDNIEFVVQRHPMRAQRRNIRGGGHLYGLYEGIALPYRGSGYDRVVPDRVTIFWGTLTRDFPDDGTLEDEVRKTVYHEIAHYFGLDEHDLEHTRVE